MITGFFNLLNAPLQVALCKYVPSQGVIRLQWPYRQVRWNAKQAALASGKGRRRLYTQSWLMYIWWGGGGFIKRALCWATGEHWGPSVCHVVCHEENPGAWGSSNNKLIRGRRHTHCYESSLLSKILLVAENSLNQTLRCKWLWVQRKYGTKGCS